MTKILFMIHDLDVGRVEKVLVNLVNHMDRTLFDITVVALFGGGMSDTIFKQYLRSPKSFRIMRQMDLSLPGPLPFLIKKSIHYDSSCILSGEAVLSGTPHKLLALLCWPAGWAFTTYLKHKVKNR